MPARALTAALALALAACADDPAAGSPPPTDADADADVTVEMREMAYEPDEIVVPAGEPVTLRLYNAGALRHNLVLADGTESDTLNAEESALLEVGPLEESVTAWCSIPGHRNAGMELEITVEP